MYFRNELYLTDRKNQMQSPGPVKSSRPVPILQELEKKVVEKKRLPETREQAVWVGRMKTFLAVRRFGLLLAKAEKV